MDTYLILFELNDRQRFKFFYEEKELFNFIKEFNSNIRIIDVLRINDYENIICNIN